MFGELLAFGLLVKGLSSVGSIEHTKQKKSTSFERTKECLDETNENDEYYMRKYINLHLEYFPQDIKLIRQYLKDRNISDKYKY